MAIWDRKVIDKRVYFSKDALIKSQHTAFRIKLLGVTIISRKVEFDAELDDEGKGKLGFK